MNLNRREMFQMTLSGLAMSQIRLTEGPRKKTSQFCLAPGLHYFNHGSEGPTPIKAIEAVSEALRGVAEDPARAWEMAYGAAEKARLRFSEFFGCYEAELLVTRNTTEGMKLVAMSLPLGKGDEVLISDQAHPGERLSWAYREKFEGISLRQVSLPAGNLSDSAIVASFSSALSPRTKVISVPHVSSMTGVVFPVRTLGELAHRQGVFCVVDGAQAPGTMRVNFQDLACDTYATSLQKGMMAPMGMGLLYVSKPMQTVIRLPETELGLNYYTEAIGMRDVPAMLGAAAALDVLTSEGIDQVYAKIQGMRERLLAGMLAIGPLKAVTPDQRTNSSMLVAELSSAFSSAELVHRLFDKYGVRAKPLGENRIRFCLHIHLEPPDIDIAIDALRKELLT